MCSVGVLAWGGGGGGADAVAVLGEIFMAGDATCGLTTKDSELGGALKSLLRILCFPVLFVLPRRLLLFADASGADAARTPFWDLGLPPLLLFRLGAPDESAVGSSPSPPEAVALFLDFLLGDGGAVVCLEVAGSLSWRGGAAFSGGNESSSWPKKFPARSAVSSFDPPHPMVLPFEQ